MADNPGSESTFMLAATKAVGDLKQQFDDQQEQLKATQRELASLQKANRLRKIQVRILGAVVILALATAAVSIYNWVQNAGATSQLRTQAISQCVEGNTDRAAEVQVWDHILSEFLVSTKNEPPAQAEATKEFVQGTETYVMQQLAPHNCTAAYATKQGS